MILYYKDWTETEIDTVVKMCKEHETYKKMSDTINKPYGQVRSVAARIEQMERQKAAGITPLDYKIISELRVLSGKLNKIRSPYSEICDRAAKYLVLLHQEIRKEDELRQTKRDKT